ncbi:hypothetical protein H0H92_000415 [Tricholoma furcatifolium]|nr:hypothetical protein H0H92_000415 [Tricholoma furcatifolium]
MVKRAKSPDTVEDARYFTVYRPYPLNAHWELSSDVIAFSRWIAACIGTEFLHALHYKPSAPGMVLIEVDKRYQETQCLLGEHFWKDFLKKPSGEEVERSTQIFHSLYATGREAQKDGWKRIHAEASWFKDWDPTEKYFCEHQILFSRFVAPYPPTQWCPTPVEDRTNKPLCRPLPVKVKPPPPKATPPVPGSAGWVDQKAAPPQDTPEAKKNAWAKKPQIVPAASPRWNEPIMASASQAAKSRSSNQTPSTKPSAGAWGKPLQAKAAPAPTSPPPNAVSQAPAFPPGLNVGPKPDQTVPVPPGLTKFNWADDVDSASASGSGSDSRSSDLPDPEKLGDMLEKKVTIPFSPSEMYGISDGTQEIGAMAPWEESSIPGSNSVGWSVDSEGDTSANLWENEPAPEAEQIPECPHHKTLCKKGICDWRSKLEKKKAQEAVRGRGGRGRGRGKGQSERRDSNEGDDDDSGFSKVGGRRGKRTSSGHGRHA